MRSVCLEPFGQTTHMFWFPPNFSSLIPNKCGRVAFPSLCVLATNKHQSSCHYTIFNKTKIQYFSVQVPVENNPNIQIPVVIGTGGPQPEDISNTQVATDQIDLFKRKTTTYV